MKNFLLPLAFILISLKSFGTVYTVTLVAGGTPTPATGPTVTCNVNDTICFDFGGILMIGWDIYINSGAITSSNLIYWDYSSAKCYYIVQASDTSYDWVAHPCIWAGPIPPPTIFLTHGKINIIAHNPDGINEAEQNISIQIFPNPSSEIIHIESKTVLGKLRIINVSGQEVFSTITNDNRHAIDISQFSNGIYFIEANGQCLKLIKE